MKNKKLYKEQLELYTDVYHIRRYDPKSYEILKREFDRQFFGIELIASENYVSPAVLEALGSIFTNKYSEGYPKKRYYGGNQYVDEIELLAIERAKKLFGVKYVNVQPYSGSPANMAVYMALAKPQDTIMGLSLSSGGHLTHGYKVSFSGYYYNAVNYTVGADELLDYEHIQELARKHKPKIIWCGASAYSRIIDFARLRKIADEVGAFLVADIAHIAGLVATGYHPSPVGYAHVITTTTHKTLRGPRGGMIMTNDESLFEKINKAVFPGLQGGPHDHVTFAKAVAFKEALSDKFKDYAKQIIKNAQTMANEFIELGYRVVSGGTDNHLFILDITSLGIEELGGKRAQEVLEYVGISVNKNTIPNDKRSPWDPSGIRIGTPAITTRGFKEEDAKEVVRLIDTALKNYKDQEKLDDIKEKVRDLASGFALFSEEWLS